MFADPTLWSILEYLYCDCIKSLFSGDERDLSNIHRFMTQEETPSIRDSTLILKWKEDNHFLLKKQVFIICNFILSVTTVINITTDDSLQLFELVIATHNIFQNIIVRTLALSLIITQIVLDNVASFSSIHYPFNKWIIFYSLDPIDIDHIITCNLNLKYVQEITNCASTMRYLVLLLRLFLSLFKLEKTRKVMLQSQVFLFFLHFISCVIYPSHSIKHTIKSFYLLNLIDFSCSKFYLGFFFLPW